MAALRYASDHCPTLSREPDWPAGPFLTGPALGKSRCGRPQSDNAAVLGGHEDVLDALRAALRAAVLRFFPVSRSSWASSPTQSFAASPTSASCAAPARPRSSSLARSSSATRPGPSPTNAAWAASFEPASPQRTMSSSCSSAPSFRSTGLTGPHRPRHRSTSQCSRVTTTATAICANSSPTAGRDRERHFPARHRGHHRRRTARLHCHA